MLSDQVYERSKILIVDDDESNVLLVRRLLEWAGYARITSTSDATEALGLFERVEPDLVLLDLHMPGLSGIEVLRSIRESREDDFVPVLVFSGDVTKTSRQLALAAGASDFLTKPGDPNEITLRVRNFLELRHLHRAISDQNRLLEERVQERTQELADSQRDVLERLARAAEFRDDDTGEHAKRVGELAAAVATQLGLPADEVELIRAAAPLHDLGKIGISDLILLKPDKLTDEERSAMQRHTEIGGQILSNGKTDLIRMAETIALTHHEKWDGTGYPGGLAGKLIPLPGRIVAAVDVFDALTHDRPYKGAWTEAAAMHEISKLSGSHFDPDVVTALLTVLASELTQAA